MSWGIVQFKSDKFHTSIYPPIISTLKVVPTTLSLVTEVGPVSKEPDVGFL